MSFKRILILRLTLWILKNEQELRILQQNKWRFQLPFHMDCEGLNDSEIEKIVKIRNKYRIIGYDKLYDFYMILLSYIYFEDIVKYLLEKYVEIKRLKND